MTRAASASSSLAQARAPVRHTNAALDGRGRDGMSTTRPNARRRASKFVVLIGIALLATSMSTTIGASAAPKPVRATGSVGQVYVTGETPSRQLALITP